MKSVLDSKFYRYLEVFSAFLFLSLAWAVACIPVVTVFPATAALFAVVRKWTDRREFDGSIRNFLAFFRENFRQSVWLEVVWAILAAVIVINLYLVVQMPEILRMPLYVFFFVAGFFFLATSSFLFPVMVHYDAGWRKVIETSFLLSLSHFPTTLTVLSVLLVSACLAFVFPPTLLLFGSAVAYIVYQLCGRAFAKVAAKSLTKNAE